MENVIELDITNENDLYEKYNKRTTSKKLIEYIVEEAMMLRIDENVKININNYLEDDIETTPIILQGLEKALDDNKRKYRHNNMMQTTFLICGIIILFISTLLWKSVFKEIILIFGTVLIWQIVEIEIFTDLKGKRRRKIIEKLLDSEIIENKCVE